MFIQLLLQRVSWCAQEYLLQYTIIGLLLKLNEPYYMIPLWLLTYTLTSLIHGYYWVYSLYPVAHRCNFAIFTLHVFQSIAKFHYSNLIKYSGL